MIKFAAAAVLLVLLASCTEPPFYRDPVFPEIAGVKEGDTAGEVEHALGKPNDRATGWWVDGGVCYRDDWQVWYYAGKGLVVFDGFSGRVVISQADPHQPKHALRQPFGGPSMSE